MRTKLHSFPSVSLSDVNEFEDTMDRYARAFAHTQAQKQRETRSEEKIYVNTMTGNRAKVAACLANGRDPLEEVDWVHLGQYNDGYTYLGDKESYVISVYLEDIQDEKIQVSFSQDKYKNRILKSIEKGNYSPYTEFVTYDPESELYFHLGKLSSDNVKEPIDVRKWLYVFEFNISPHREDGLLVLS